MKFPPYYALLEIVILAPKRLADWLIRASGEMPPRRFAGAANGVSESSRSSSSSWPSPDQIKRLMHHNPSQLNPGQPEALRHGVVWDDPIRPTDWTT